MEKKTLPKPAVAGILEEHYIEARLHADKPIPELDEILALQEKFAESIALPIYVTIDPTDERRLGKFEGAVITSEGEQDFIDFLKDAVTEKEARR